MAVTPPNGGEQHIVRTINWTQPRWDPDAGQAASMDMLEAQFATKGRFSWRRWYVCRRCGFIYPQDEVKIVGGSAYCYKRKCVEHMSDTGGIAYQ